MNENFTDAEKEILSNSGYDSLSWFAWKANSPEIRKEKTHSIYFSVGVEGVDRDVDGDSGWARSWRSFESLEEAMSFALSNPVYQPIR